MFGSEVALLPYIWHYIPMQSTEDFWCYDFLNAEPYFDSSRRRFLRSHAKLNVKYLGLWPIFFKFHATWPSRFEDIAVLSETGIDPGAEKWQ